MGAWAGLAGALARVAVVAEQDVLGEQRQQDAQGQRDDEGHEAGRSPRRAGAGRGAGSGAAAARCRARGLGLGSGPARGRGRVGGACGWLRLDCRARPVVLLHDVMLGARRPQRRRAHPDGAAVGFADLRSAGSDERHRVQPGDVHAEPRVGRVDDPAAADVDADVADRAVVEDQVAGLQVADRRRAAPRSTAPRTSAAARRRQRPRSTSSGRSSRTSPARPRPTRRGHRAGRTRSSRPPPHGLTPVRRTSGSRRLRDERDARMASERAPRARSVAAWRIDISWTRCLASSRPSRARASASRASTVRFSAAILPCRSWARACCSATALRSTAALQPGGLHVGEQVVLVLGDLGEVGRLAQEPGRVARRAAAARCCRGRRTCRTRPRSGRPAPASRRGGAGWRRTCSGPRAAGGSCR